MSLGWRQAPAPTDHGTEDTGSTGGGSLFLFTRPGCRSQKVTQTVVYQATS